jgi:hypothetical protein
MDMPAKDWCKMARLECRVEGSMDWVEWLILGLAFPIAIACYFFEGAGKKSNPDVDEDR